MKLLSTPTTDDRADSSGSDRDMCWDDLRGSIREDYAKPDAVVAETSQCPCYCAYGEAENARLQKFLFELGSQNWGDELASSPFSCLSVNRHAILPLEG